MEDTLVHDEIDNTHDDAYYRGDTLLLPKKQDKEKHEEDCIQDDI